MTNQQIPDEAVEAAAKSIFALSYDAREWDEAIWPRKARYLEDARAALEATAPQIAATAWDEAIVRATEVAWEHDASASSGVSQIPNPYRRSP